VIDSPYYLLKKKKKKKRRGENRHGVSAHLVGGEDSEFEVESYTIGFTSQVVGLASDNRDVDALNPYPRLSFPPVLPEFPPTCVPGPAYIFCAKGGAAVVQRLLGSGEAASSGIMETTVYQLWTKDMEDPDWKDLVPHFHRMSPQELHPHNVAGGCGLVPV
jgi:hypothetical protein